MTTTTEGEPILRRRTLIKMRAMDSFMKKVLSGRVVFGQRLPSKLDALARAGPQFILVKHSPFGGKRCILLKNQEFCVEQSQGIAVCMGGPSHASIQCVRFPGIGRSVSHGATCSCLRHGQRGMVQAIEINEADCPGICIDEYIAAGKIAVGDSLLLQDPCAF